MKISLVMIVKNEAHCIERCLRSLIPHISHWTICDTGSTDRTKEIIEHVLTDIPGELYEDEWVHFAHNRTLAIQRAKGKGDYHLMMDADHVWCGEFPPLTADGYQIEHRYDFMVYGIPCLMKDGFDWFYECPIHETVKAKNSGTFIPLPSPPYIKVYHEGARSRDPLTYRKDAAILLKHVTEHPDEPRATYYLAQSYFNAGMIQEARDWYEKRCLMESGWWEERWHASFRVAQMGQKLELPFPVVMAEYLSSFEANHQRAEPLVTLARYARLHNPPHFAIAIMAARQAMTIPKPAVGLFVESIVYDWVAADEFAVSSYYAGNKEEGLRACQKLLQSPLLPENERPRVEANVKWFKGMASAVAEVGTAKAA